jgi:hydrogenase expression/formation protein HypC
MCLAVPGEVVEVQEEHGLRFGKVRFGGVRRRVCLEYVPEAQVGDYVVVHVGFAISLVDREEAERTLRLIEQMGQAEELRLEEALEGVTEAPAPASPGPGEEGAA